MLTTRGIAAAALAAAMSAAALNGLPAYADPAPPPAATGAAAVHDSARTRADRAELARLQAATEATVERLDRAGEQLAAAQRALAAAERRSAAAQREAAAARAALARFASAAYMEGPAQLGPTAVAMLSAGDPVDVLSGVTLLHVVGQGRAAVVAVLRNAERAARAAQQEAGTQRRARAALVRDIATQRARLLAALDRQRRLVGHDQAADVSAELARQRDAAQAGLRAAADDLKTYALATGAARPADFPATLSMAQVVQVADRTLLAAAGRSHAPADDPAPAVTLGHTDPPAAPAAPQRWDGRVVTGLGGTGVGLTGLSPSKTMAAPLLPADGVNVAPTLLPARASASRAEEAVEAALGQLGRPYVWGAAGPATYDCSGLTQWAWGHAGVALDHFAATQWRQGRLVAPGSLLPGDLVLFGRDLHHVGLYLGHGWMVDAPHTGDYVKVQRVTDFTDYVGAVRP